MYQATLQGVVDTNDDIQDCIIPSAGGRIIIIYYHLYCYSGYRFIVTMLAVIGKACILATFLGIYVFTVELYPTIIR